MRFLVGLYFFTFLLGHVDGSGEYCHGWADAHNTWHSGFHCPEQYDGHDAKYCCGTCGALRYCCTGAESRLDQSSCAQEHLHELENNDNSANISPQVPTYLPFVIVVGTFLSFVLIGVAVSICCCYCLKPKDLDHQNGSPPLQTNLLESARLSPETMTPSRVSSSSSSSNARSTMTSTMTSRQPTFGTEVNMNMFGPLSDGGYQAAGSQFYVPHSQTHGGFYQPYLNYGIPPEHTVLMSQTFADHQQMYGPSLICPIPQTPMHTEQLYTGVTM